MKSALITGVDKGIGKALAEKFLAEGWFVLGAHHKVAPEARENFLSFPLELASPQSIEEFSKAIQNTGKKIDVLINNAGVLVDVEETKVLIPKLRETLEVNLFGTVDLTEHLIPLMISGGHIITITSSAGSLAEAGKSDSSHYPYHYPAYKISKAALNMYTRTLANRFQNEKLDIRASSVHPGWVKTNMGGEDADMTPEEAAEHIFKLATSNVETGQFWFKGEKYPW